ncbi:cell surface protein [Natronolimnohabitans sp. A-GB9]|uniref:YncE family protein n=1 Tax=Natronolimnohabitans sp. A-GB9 TaxID=3069757 RepID=UPI0027B28288|nr:cell surface protein [Natronolimnohabitans sp. A-GB9]MDQ2051323.1 cell surface protein [Natronolimnohabitans sp. A-GB9]
MQTNQTRRTFLAGSAAAGAVAVAGCIGGDDDDDGEDEETEFDYEIDPELEEGDGSYEVWALDQGRDNVFVYEPADTESGEAEFALTEFIDVNDLEDVPDEGVVPHMIDYSSDYEYAAVACTAGARTLVFRTEDHELVGNIETGAGSHMAAFSPDDEYIHVDAIDEGAIVRVDADLESEEFEVVDEIEVLEDETVQEAGVEDGAPICHQFDNQGRSIHTLGPSYHDAGLVIVDHDEFAVTQAFSQDELPTNCGTMPHPTEDKFYLTAGLPSSDEEGVGAYYVLDTSGDEVTVEVEDESTEGVDAHGFWFTPDGDELWVLNRETNDGVVVDPETNEVLEEIDEYGPEQSEDPAESDAPDIMWASPDGEYMFVTLRGPAPLSGDPHASTGVTPGVSVLSVDDREVVDVIEPHPIDEFDDEHIELAQDEDEDGPRVPDFHAVGVRPLEAFDTGIETSPPFGEN